MLNPDESKPLQITDLDVVCFRRAIELALEAEKGGNLSIGAVISLDGEIIAEGKNTIWHPKYDPIRHAEIEALCSSPDRAWNRSRSMSLYTTLEPCIMCAGAILQHQIGRVLYGSSDSYGGASLAFGHLPPYFEDQLSNLEWLGPAYPEQCDRLYERVMDLVEKRRIAGLNQ